MALTYKQKENVVADIKALAQEAHSLVVMHYHGIDSSDMAAMRGQGRKAGVSFKVARNTLVRIALKDTAYAPLLENITGPVMTIFSLEEPSAGARLLRDAKKEISALEIVAFGVGGVAYSGKEIERLASLPTREEAITKIAYLLKAPITNLAKDLKEVPARLARVLVAVKDSQ